MATQMLYMQWRTVRLALIPFVIAAFGLPLLAVQPLGGMGGGWDIAGSALEALQGFLPLFPLLAAAIGMTLGLSAWNWDHKGEHIYALSLPVSRMRYAMLKFGAGAVVILVPAAALLAGSLVATWAATLPTGLEAYPFRLTIRFVLATLLCYAVIFSMAAGTIRTAVIVLSVAVGVPVLASVVIDFAAVHYPILDTWPSVAEVMAEWLVEFGPFRVMTGNWMLIDV